MGNANARTSRESYFGRDRTAVQHATTRGAARLRTAVGACFRAPTLEGLETRLVLSDPGIGVGASETDFGSIVPIVRETGLISLSVDGLGTNSTSGTIQVNKPAGATVRKAFMAAASTGFSGRVLANGDVKIDGANVNWGVTTPSSIFSSNHWADVTSLVKPKVDAAAAGRVNLTVTEVGTDGIDGEVLAVIFDDPNQTTSNTVALLFGAQNINGDTFAIGLAEPIDKSDPNLAMDMSLGISFGFQPSGQYSIVNVNGTRLSTSAGGQDDGQAANGALLTVGGLDDTNANPANPLLTDVNGPRSDDELYSLLPFVNNGATSINVFTQNPSTDDNIFFAALNLKSTTAVVGEGIVLAPAETTSEVGDQHTVTATLQNSLGQPITNRAVAFTITAGPHAGQTGTGTTDANGKATFTYTGSAAGNDQIQASFANNQGQTVLSNTVISKWVSTNRAPSASPGGPYEVDEGDAVTLTALGQDLDGDPLTYAWDLDNNGTFETAGQTVTFSAAGMDGPGTHTIAVQVSDGKVPPETTTGTVTINNVAPAASAGADQSVSEGDTVTLTGNFTDPGLPDTHTLVWEVKDGHGAVVAGGSGLGISFVPADNGVYTATFTVTDDDGGVGTGSAVVTVDNVSPTARPVTVDSATIDENGTVTVSGSYTDPGSGDTHTVTIHWADGTSSAATVDPATKTFWAAHRYLDDDPTATPSDAYAITATLVDDDGGSDTSGPAALTVRNVAPVVTITGPAAGAVVAAGTPVNFGGLFTDAGTLDAHTVVWTVDGGSFGVAAVDFAGTVDPATGAVSGTYAFAAPGVYKVRLTVTDDDSGATSAGSVDGFEATVVVYDPSAGFVTGGGWIDSPAGAYAADPTLAGKATFGFVSRYKKGASAPTGSTEFQFKAGGLNFHSNQYDWMVVNGHKAQYKGTGTVNGVAGYRFKLTVIDGQKDGTGQDKFRIQIWAPDGGVVYDNLLGQRDDADPTTAIGGGSILIHS